MTNQMDSWSPTKPSLFFARVRHSIFSMSVEERELVAS
jgi:hypothetical protein